MKREILAVVVGIAASMLLLAIGGMILTNSKDTRVFLESKQMYESEQAISADQVDLLFSSIKRQLKTIEWVVLPIIVLLTGMVSGLIGKKHRPLLGMLSAAPISILMVSATPKFEYAMLLLYLLLAAAGASIILIKNKILSSNKAL